MWVVLACLAFAGPEEDAARAQEVYDNGKLLYAEGLYEDAIAAYQEAYRLTAVPTVLLNIANAYERLQRFEDAIAVLNRYRAFARADEREAIRSRIEAVRERMEASPDYVRKGVVPLPIPPLRTTTESPSAKGP